MIFSFLRFVLFSLYALAASPGAAQTTADQSFQKAQQSMTMALNIARLLNAEKFCGLSYSQPAIQAWLEANVRPDDPSFHGNLDLFTLQGDSQLQAMSESAKTAHCTLVTKMARHVGFID